MIQIKLLVDNIDLTARSISGLHCCLKQGCFSLIYLFQVFLCLINKCFVNENTNTIAWIITLDKNYLILVQDRLKKGSYLQDNHIFREQQ